MILDFKGPFHFEHLNNPKLVGIEKPGIYIWGFIYKFDEKGLIETVDFNPTGIPEINEKGSIDLQKNWKFIPHYVGLASGKSNVFINTRLKQHHNVKKGNAAKYKRLSCEYMKVFFKDDDFPIWIKRKTKNNDFSPLIKSGKITYIFDTKVNLPITDLKIDDTLDVIINKETKNNFWFCYKKLEEYEVNEITEAFVFWSLKGKTISQTLPFDSIKIYKDCYKVNGKLPIFKDNRPSDIFLGDY